MPPILYASTLSLPAGENPSPQPQPRYEIGDWFVTIYYASPDDDPDDAPHVEAIARALQGSLGERAPMFLNQHHPSIPLGHSVGSRHPGTLEEMHATPPDYGHFHIELIGARRDVGFAGLGVLDTLKRHLEMFVWEHADSAPPGEATPARAG